MDYEGILDTLHQELAGLDRVIGFLTKAGERVSPSANITPPDQAKTENEGAAEQEADNAVLTQLVADRISRKDRREPMLESLLEERALLMQAIEAIFQLSERE